MCKFKDNHVPLVLFHFMARNVTICLHTNYYYDILLPKALTRSQMSSGTTSSYTSKIVRENILILFLYNLCQRFYYSIKNKNPALYRYFTYLITYKPCESAFISDQIVFSEIYNEHTMTKLVLLKF